MPEWVADIYARCQEEGVPFWFKQAGDAQASQTWGEEFEKVRELPDG